MPYIIKSSLALRNVRVKIRGYSQHLMLLEDLKLL